MQKGMSVENGKTLSFIHRSVSSLLTCVILSLFIHFFILLLLLFVYNTTSISNNFFHTNLRKLQMIYIKIKLVLKLMYIHKKKNLSCKMYKDKILV